MPTCLLLGLEGPHLVHNVLLILHPFEPNLQRVGNAVAVLLRHPFLRNQNLASPALAYLLKFGSALGLYGVVIVFPKLIENQIPVLYLLIRDTFHDFFRNHAAFKWG